MCALRKVMLLWTVSMVWQNHLVQVQQLWRFQKNLAAGNVISQTPKAIKISQQAQSKRKTTANGKKIFSVQFNRSKKVGHPLSRRKMPWNVIISLSRTCTTKSNCVSLNFFLQCSYAKVRVVGTIGNRSVVFLLLGFQMSSDLCAFSCINQNSIQVYDMTEIRKGMPTICTSKQILYKNTLELNYFLRQCEYLNAFFSFIFFYSSTWQQHHQHDERKYFSNSLEFSTTFHWIHRSGSRRRWFKWTCLK